MTNDDLFSWIQKPTGAELRDEGIERVLDHNENWLQACLEEAERFIRSQRMFTGEDIRIHCQAVVGHPAHHNAWGGLISSLVKKRMIVPTGKHQHMRDPVSHARQTPVYFAGEGL